MSLWKKSQSATPVKAERRRLLPDSTETDIDSASYGSDLRNSPTPELPVKPLNDISRKDLAWTLIGLWSAVFLGSLDGLHEYQPNFVVGLNKKNALCAFALLFDSQGQL
jgi:hypothetical protein